MDSNAHAASVDPYAAMHIRYKARKLIGRHGFTEDDVEDIEQELTTDYLIRRSNFDPKRSSLHTFIVRIVRHKIATMIEHREASLRDHRRMTFSLNEPVKDARGQDSQRFEMIDAEAKFSGRPEREAHQLKLDVEDVVSGLPDDLKRLCALLQTKSISEVSRELGIPRATLYGAIGGLRLHFKDAGLWDYLEKT